MKHSEAEKRRRFEVAERINTIYPVSQIISYGAGCFQVKREAIAPIKNRPFADSKRGRIRKLSQNAITRLIVYAQATPIVFESMITLTYGKYYPQNGQIVKSDINYICTWLKRNYDTNYLWFLEFQKRKAPHVHILVEPEEITPRMRVRLGLNWVERQLTSDWFTGHNLTPEAYAKQAQNLAGFNCHPKVWELIRSDGGARRYVTKYAAKSYQKDVPAKFQDVGRFWGCSRDVRPMGATIDVTDEEVRQFLKEREHQVADWDVLPKYLFNVSRETSGVDSSREEC